MLSVLWLVSNLLWDSSVHAPRKKTGQLIISTYLYMSCTTCMTRQCMDAWDTYILLSWEARSANHFTETNNFPPTPSPSLSPSPPPSLGMPPSAPFLSWVRLPLFRYPLLPWICITVLCHLLLPWVCLSLLCASPSPGYASLCTITSSSPGYTPLSAPPLLGTLPSAPVVVLPSALSCTPFPCE